MPTLPRGKIWQRFFGSSVSTATGYGIGLALGPPLEPITQQIANEVWALYPDKPLSPQEAAAAVVRDLMTLDAARAESEKTGVAAWRFDILHGLAGEPPAAGQLLELWNRGVLEPADVDRGLRQSRMRPEWFAAFKDLRHVLVPVSDLVRMAVREVFDQTQRAALTLDADFPAAVLEHSRRLGLSDQAMRDYWAAHWNLPSYEQLAQMLFRGLLTRPEFAAALKAADYAPAWRDRLEAIARAIPSLSDMTRFAVREVYDADKRRALGLDAEYPERFTTEAAKHGLAESDARDLWAAHWRLPSAEQGYRMLHRGEIDLRELDTLLKALDYPTLWRDRLRNVAYLTLGRVDLRRAFAAGVIDQARVRRGYLELGYKPADADTLTELAVALARSSGTSHAERAATSLFTAAHRSFVNGESDDAQARAAMAAAGVPQGERGDVLDLWSHERELVRRQLTPAQLKKAWQGKETNPATGAAWTRDETLARLTLMGFSPNDAATFLDL